MASGLRLFPAGADADLTNLYDLRPSMNRFLLV